MKIINAKKYKIGQNSSDLPDVSDGVSCFMQPTTVEIIRKEQVDGYTQEEKTCVKTMAVRQPYSAEQLAIRPEGQRSWKWHTIHCLPNLILKTDDIVNIHGIHYRIMQKTDWKDYGYIQYEVVEDYRTDD